MKPSNWSGTKKTGLLIIAVILLIGAGIQFANPEIEHPSVTGRLTAPKEVTEIFKRACYNCHSNETQLKWYDKIAPVSWIINHDVKEARSRFNFSEWNKLTTKEQQTILWKTVNAVIAGKMPIPVYVAVHPEARISSTEIANLKKYLNALPNNKPADAGAAAANAKAANDERQNCRRTNAVPDTTPMALNGVKYVSGYTNWKVISSTNRFDNYTIRVVYGNAIAVKAIEENQINPFPNGASIVKVVWNKIEEKDGTVRPGTFNCVQIMTRDDKKYPKTGGWGFAIFNGLKLIPTGKTALFENDCYNCHKLQAADNGYLFNIPLKNIDLSHEK